MALLAVASDKGSPGVTTISLILAAVWPRRSIYSELDPFGGDIGFRLRGASGKVLSPDRGALSLAAALRRDPSGEQIFDHVQRLDGGLEVLVGPPTAEYAAHLRGSALTLARALNGVPSVDVIADCGQLYPQTPILDVLKGSSAIVLVTLSSVEAVAHLRFRASWLMQQLAGQSTEGVPLYVVVVTHPHDQKSVREIDVVLHKAGIPAVVIGRVAEDPKGAAMLTGEWHGRLDKSLLVRSVREIAARMTDELRMRKAS